MEHLAIMKKGYIEKILSGEKKIESRFSINRVAPYGKIAPGDKVYMQEVGKEVTAVFEVKDVLFFEDLSEGQVAEIRAQYGEDICADDDFWELKKNAKYATLIYVKEPQRITPFKVYKNDRSAFKTVGSVKDELVVNRRTIVKHPHDCEKGKHYFIFDGHTRCQFCGRSFSHSKTMRAKPDYITIKNVMKESMWNDEWLHAELDNVAKSRVKKVSKHEVKKILKKTVLVFAGIMTADKRLTMGIRSIMPSTVWAAAVGSALRNFMVFPGVRSCPTAIWSILQILSWNS